MKKKGAWGRVMCLLLTVCLSVALFGCAKTNNDDYWKNDFNPFKDEGDELNP